MGERKIIIGLITSTEYLQRLQSFWNIQLIESVTAKRIAGWCWEYFEQYKKAPGKDIEGIFYSKVKDPKFPKDIAKEIEEDILPGLSAEYEQQSFNLEYLFEETKKYLSDRHISIHNDNVNSLRLAGSLEEAEKLITEFKPLSVTVDTIDDFIQSVKLIRKQKKPKPIPLMPPWLKEGQTTIIYGKYGSGKSLLTILIAYMLGLENFDTKDCEIGEWQIKNPTGTLYIDGELGEQEMEERIGKFEWLGKQQGKYVMRILSIPEYQVETEDSFSLSERENQLKVIHWLKDHPNYKLLVLDSVSTLFGLEEENSNSEWDKKINPFLRDLRALNVACILLHHAGKDGKRGLRGASSMGAMAHNIFSLAIHTEKDPGKGEAWFTIMKDKQRAAGYSFKTFTLKFKQTEDEKETHWEVTSDH